MCILYGSIARHTAFIRGGFMLKMSSTISSSSTPRSRNSFTSAATFSGERKRNRLAENIVAIRAQKRAAPRGKDRRIAFALEQRHEVPHLGITVEIDKVPGRQRNGIEVVDHADRLLIPMAQRRSCWYKTRPAQNARSGRRYRPSSCRRETSAGRRSETTNPLHRRRSNRRLRSRRSSGYSDGRMGLRWRQ